jgi:RHS repeat-associated protein
VHAYDALGRRVRTVVQTYVGGQWTAFSTTERDFLGRLPLGIETSFVDGSAKSWRFMRGPDASGTLEGAGGARGVLAVLKDASYWKAVAADTLGNVLALAGTNGDFQRRTFDPWGNPLTRDASGSLRASTLSERRADYDALPLAWASQEVDPDTGLTHYHFREYSPSLGGWLTQDPIGLAGGYLNLRSYLGNRPTDALDTWGIWSLNFSVDYNRKLSGRGYLSFSIKSNLLNGRGTVEISASGGWRMYFTEAIASATGTSPIMGTMLGILMEANDITQEIRIGVGGNGTLSCTCPDNESAIKCTLTKFTLRVFVQGLIGYQSGNLRAIGQATGAGEWDLLTGQVSVVGSMSIRLQEKQGSTWAGIEYGTSGKLKLPIDAPSINSKEFQIPLPTKCKCMKNDVDATPFVSAII